MYSWAQTHGNPSGVQPLSCARARVARIRAALGFDVEPPRGNTTPSPRRGFSLLEVLTAITIIAFLCGLIVGLARHATHTARRQKAGSELANWGEALHRWHARFGEYPEPENAAGGNGIPVSILYDFTDFLDFDEPPVGRVFYEQTGSTTNETETALLPLAFKDPWGMEYRYQLISKDDYELWSPGPDSKSKTPDDIRLAP